MEIWKISYRDLKCVLLACLLQPAFASAEFTTGPVVESFGPVADVEQTVPLTGREHFKIVFDASEQGKGDKRNRKFESLARFLNMQARAGVKPEQIELALVVHGGAGFDVLNDTAYQKKFQRDNPNVDLLAALQKNRVRIILCGQSAAYNGIGNKDLLPGVEMALSAMTAHALLQQQGYTLNPW